MPLPGLLWECISTRHQRIHPQVHQKPGSACCFTACESISFPNRIFHIPPAAPGFLLIQQCANQSICERLHRDCDSAGPKRMHRKDGDGVTYLLLQSLLGPRATLFVTGQVTLHFFARINCSSCILVCHYGSRFPWCQMG